MSSCFPDPEWLCCSKQKEELYPFFLSLCILTQQPAAVSTGTAASGSCPSRRSSFHAQFSMTNGFVESIGGKPNGICHASRQLWPWLCLLTCFPARRLFHNFGASKSVDLRAFMKFGTGFCDSKIVIGLVPFSLYPCPTRFLNANGNNSLNSSGGLYF